MLSDAAYAQLHNRRELDVVSLGRFRLKSVGRPVELYAVAVDGVVVPDPGALEGKGERFASLPNNLPDPGSATVGRASDLDSLVDLVRNHRAVTITGPGGVGKTRVLIELGRRLAPGFLDGVALAPLADVTDPAGFVPALAEALDVKESEERSLTEGIVALVGERLAGAPVARQLRADRCRRARGRCAPRPAVRSLGCDDEPDAAEDLGGTGVSARAAQHGARSRPLS